MVVFIPPPLVGTSQGLINGGWVALVLGFISGHWDTSQQNSRKNKQNIPRFAKSKEAQENGFHLLKMVRSLFTGLSVKYVDSRWNE